MLQVSSFKYAYGSDNATCTYSHKEEGNNFTLPCVLTELHLTHKNNYVYKTQNFTITECYTI